MNDSDLARSCAQKMQIVRRSQLPWCCPPEDTTLWNGHPKVYLALEKEGHVKCPYCGTMYILQDGT